MANATRSISINNIDVPYTIRKRKGQRQFTLSVHASGKVTLTIPRWVSFRAGHKYVLSKHSWLIDALRGIHVPNAEAIAREQREYVAHREQSRTLLRQRLHELNRHYGFTFSRVFIRRTSSRWGSCSSKNNLSFDYRVALLPARLRDYILVHELCHLKEMNHGPRFWALVEETLPDYAQRRAELKKVVRHHLHQDI